MTKLRYFSDQMYNTQLIKYFIYQLIPLEQKGVKSHYNVMRLNPFFF